MTPSTKPQCNAARAYIEALHAHKAGTITTAERDAIGEKLNASIREHGKP